MVVVDIGSNIGYYTLIAAKILGSSGKVYAFEPEPNNYELLLKNIEVNGYTNIVPVQKADEWAFDLKTYVSSPEEGFPWESGRRQPAAGAEAQSEKPPVRRKNRSKAEASAQTEVEPEAMSSTRPETRRKTKPPPRSPARQKPKVKAKPPTLQKAQKKADFGVGEIQFSLELAKELDIAVEI